MSHTPSAVSHALGCGCRFRCDLEAKQGNRWTIDWCPLHEAAPALLAALKRLVDEVLWITDQTDSGRLAAIERLHRDGTAIETARAVIAAAEETK